MVPIPILNNMFGRSPIKPLQSHMATVHACVQELLPFFDAVLAEDWDRADKLRDKVAKLEDEADDMKRTLRLHLPRGLFMPVSRIDILELLTRQDMLANKAKDIAGLIVGRRLSFPKETHESVLRLLERSVQASAQADKAINELSDLFEAGFGGKEVEVIEGMITKLLKIERDTDKLLITVRRKVFGLESALNPVDVVFLYKVLEWMGDLGNHAQHVGDRLQILIAR